VLEKEMSAALKELQGLVKDGRNAIAKQVGCLILRPFLLLSPSFFGTT
jgi:hypothetical protein